MNKKQELTFHDAQKQQPQEEGQEAKETPKSRPEPLRRLHRPDSAAAPEPTYRTTPEAPNPDPNAQQEEEEGTFETYLPVQTPRKRRKKRGFFRTEAYTAGEEVVATIGGGRTVGSFINRCGYIKNKKYISFFFFTKIFLFYFISKWYACSE